MTLHMWWARLTRPSTGRELWVRTRANGELNDGDFKKFGTRGPVPEWYEVEAATETVAKKLLAAGTYVTHRTTRDSLEAVFRQEVAQSLRDSPDERRKRLKRAARSPQKVPVLSFAFRRNPDVAAEVLVRAAGRCDRCHAKAPFQRKSDGTPYLEVHHRIFLALGGEDTVANAMAICPNCHRELHFGKDSP